MIDEFSDGEIAAVVKSIDEEGDGGPRHSMMREVTVAVMQYINEAELDELGEDEAEEILSDIDVKDVL
jgi:hypothetical protein